MKTALSISSVLLSVVLATASHAQQDGPRDGFSIGIIANYGTNPYIGEDDEVTPLPLINYRSGSFSIGVQGLFYDFYSSQGLTLSTGVTPRFSALADADAPELSGIDREITADAFFGVAYDINQNFGFEAIVRQELTGEHDGQEIQLALGYQTQALQTGFGLNAGVRWQSEDLANYTWGVRPSEAIVGRPAYDTGDVIIPYLSLDFVRSLNENLALIGQVQAEFLPSEVSDSPIVEEDTLFGITLGVSYSF